MQKRNVYIETYGCQMNFSDSEIVAGILTATDKYSMVSEPDNADIIFLNTCSVRDNAEQTIFKRLEHLKHYKKKKGKLVVGILGCMAERLRDKLIGHNNLVSIVVGPDEYRKVPELLGQAYQGEAGIAVKLSRVETYEDILPLRVEGISAWISIMRGCDNFCSYCVVPYTRGRERSRPAASLLKEIKDLEKGGIKEITLLGQNVNSYMDKESNMDFPDLLRTIAEAVPHVRVRYTTSHPKDISDKLIEAMSEHKNICNYIHLPVQSGSNKVLKEMLREYTVEHYLERIAKCRELIPNVSFSTDIIAGFPNETEEEHQMTLELLRKVRYDGAFMFKYSPRENTRAFKMEDNVDEEAKIRRLNEIIELQHEIARELNKEEIGRVHEVLVEGPSKKNEDEWMGRSDTNKVVIFPNADRKYKIGDLVNVKITESTSATLKGERVE